MLSILYEDNHCVAVNKPAGLLAQGDRTGEPTLVDQVKAYLKERYAKPGNVYVGLVHRLDRPTSGVVLLARTSKAAARLSAQFHQHTTEKVYCAIVEGFCQADAGEWVDTLLKDAGRNVVSVVPPGTPGAQDAHTAFRVLERLGARTLMELRPTTGRPHQLRVQLASRGLPIAGDRKYGAKTRLFANDGHPRVALHARSLKFIHPTTRATIEVTAPVPADWPVHSSRN